MTISFNSMGMYALGKEASNQEFFGTYGIARDITERKQAEALISYQAYHDILTDLPNRLLFKDRLGLAVIQARSNLTELSVMFVHWNAAGGEPPRLAMNISPNYLDHGDFFEKMQRTLLHYGISPSQIEVEITENISFRNPQHAIEQLNKLCQFGVSVAIDDFGTGYSSLAYLHRFPVHTIKIDQAFFKEIQRDNGHFPVVLAIISIARGLGLKLVAEVVETAI